MFEGINTLSALNAERRRLTLAGESVAAVNAAYNKARRALMDATPVFRKPPTFTGKPQTPVNYTPFPIRHEGAAANEIRIINGIVYF